LDEVFFPDHPGLLGADPVGDDTKLFIDPRLIGHSGNSIKVRAEPHGDNKLRSASSIAKAGSSAKTDSVSLQSDRLVSIRRRRALGLVLNVRGMYIRRASAPTSSGVQRRRPGTKAASEMKASGFSRCWARSEGARSLLQFPAGTNFSLSYLEHDKTVLNWQG
jgi:hypothetical protein